jgi:hypothetical protein
LENFLAESGFCWKKDRQDTIFLKINNSREIPRNSYITIRRKYPEGGSERSIRGPTPPGGAGQPLAAPPRGEASLAHSCHRPLMYIVIPENLSRGGIRDRHHRLCGAENTEREKLSGKQKSVGEIPSRRGEIVAIVTTITLEFIGIVIIIITNTFISTITTPSHCNILG